MIIGFYIEIRNYFKLCQCQQANIHTNKQTNIQAKAYQTAAISQPPGPSLLRSGEGLHSSAAVSGFFFFAAPKSLWTVHNYTCGTIQEQKKNHSWKTVSVIKVPTDVSKIPASSSARCPHSRRVSLKKSDNMLNLVVERDVIVYF